MSIASEISRLQTAKANIKTAIQAKGVTVPASVKLDAYDDYVAAIQTSPRLQNKTVTANGTVTADNGYDGLGTVTVNVSSSVNNQNKSVSPSGSQQVVTPDSGYSGLGQVTIGAASLQNKTVNANGIVTPDAGYYGLGQVTVNVAEGITLVPTAGDKPVLENDGIARIAATALTTTDIAITIPVAGTYRLKWTAFRSSTSGTNSTRLYRTRNGTTSAIGTEITTWTDNYFQSNQLDIDCNAGDVITVYARSRGINYYVCAGNLSACVNQNPWNNVQYSGWIDDGDL